MEVVYNTKFLLRRGTAESWEHNNPVLAYGEPGYDISNYGLKIGDGETHWKDLDFLSASKEQIEEAINKYFEENPGSGTGGAPGKDGVSATHRWQGTTLIITSASGTSSANLKGEKGDPGKTPQKYVDYWTEGDKQEIISEIPVPDLDGYATEEYVNKQIANAQLGSGSGSGSGSIDLSSYYTKSETNEVIQDAIEKIELTPGPKGDTPQKYIDYFTEEDVSEIVERVVDNIPEADVDLTGYATEKWVSDKYQIKGNYLTEVPEEYAKSSEIPTRPEDIGAQPAGEYLTSVPDGYATQEYVKNKIAEASLSGGEVDLSGYATKEELPTKISQLENDKNYLTSYNETDPTVPDWAKASTKPTYTKTEIGLDKVDNIKQYSANNPPPYPVTSINGKTGEVVLDADAVGARSSTWMPNASDVGALSINTVIPTKTSQLNNDSGFLTEHIDISGKLDASKLPEAVDIALAQAKASGDFDGTTPHIGNNGNWFIGDVDTGKSSHGENGTTPERGVHYWTEEDKAEIKSYVDDAILGGAW